MKKIVFLNTQKGPNIDNSNGLLPVRIKRDLLHVIPLSSHQDGLCSSTSSLKSLDTHQDAVGWVELVTLFLCFVVLSKRNFIGLENVNCETGC